MFVGIGQSGMVISSMIVVQTRLRHKTRGVAAALASTGFGIAAVTTGPLYKALIDHYGWRGAMVIHSGIVLQGCVLAMVYGRPLASVKSSNNDVEMRNDLKSDASRDGKTARKSVAVTWFKQSSLVTHSKPLLAQKMYLCFVAGNFVAGYGFMTMYQHTPGRAVYKGIYKLEATLILSPIGVCSLVGRLCTNRKLFLAVDVLVGAVIRILSCWMSEFYQLLVMSGLFGFFNGKNWLPTVISMPSNFSFVSVILALGPFQWGSKTPHGHLTYITHCAHVRTLHKAL